MGDRGLHQRRSTRGDKGLHQRRSTRGDRGSAFWEQHLLRSIYYILGSSSGKEACQSQQ